MFVTKYKPFLNFINKYCSEVSDIPVRGRKNYPPRSGNDPIEHGISEEEMFNRLFRDI